MASYGSDFSASTEISGQFQGEVNATDCSRLNVNSLKVTTAPGTTTPGFPGDLKVLIPATGDAAVYFCTAGTGVPTGNTWVICGEANGS